MSNMDYCRFQNTVLELKDCVDVLYRVLDEGKHSLPNDEHRAALRMVEMITEFPDWEDVRYVLSQVAAHK